MSARAEFFAGGPLHGWHEVGDVGTVRYLRPSAGPVSLDLFGVGHYHRRKWVGAGWLVPIPIWSEDETPPVGTILPGGVYGEVPEYCVIDYLPW